MKYENKRLIKKLRDCFERAEKEENEAITTELQHFFEGRKTAFRHALNLAKIILETSGDK